jgi:hypothetical protein
MKSSTQQTWFDIPPVFYQYLIGRIVMLVLFVGSLWLLVWSANRLPPLNREIEKESSRVAQLADQVDQLQAGWNPTEAQQVAKTAQETKAQFFATPEEYTKWQQEIQSQTSPLGLDASSQLLKTKPTVEEKFSVMPAVIAIEVQPSAETKVTNSPYNRLLEFGKTLAHPSKRVDVTELTVSGNSNSVTQPRIEVQLWSQAKNP